jgi:hypothetical protein
VVVEEEEEEEEAVVEGEGRAKSKLTMTKVAPRLARSASYTASLLAAASALEVWGVIVEAKRAHATHCIVHKHMEWL